MRKVRAAHTLATLHPVAGQAAPAAVGGGGPDQINLTAAGRCRSQAGRIGWEDRIRSCDGIGHVRVIRTHVAGGIDGLHPVAVARGGGETRVAECSTGRRGDLDKVRAARPLAALHAIAGDGYIVGGSSPAEIDLYATDGCGRQVRHIARRSGVGRPGWRDRGGPIGLDLRQSQHAAVDSDFVEQAAERIVAPLVADRHDVGRIIRLQGLRGRGDQGAIHIHPECIGAVGEGHRHMVPVRVGDRAGKGVAGAVGAEGQPVVCIEVEFFASGHPRRSRAFAEEMALAATYHIALGPQFDRKVCGAEVIGGGIGNGDCIVDAVEGQGLAIGGLACDPEGAVDQCADVSGPRRIRQRGPAPFVHPIGGDQTGHTRDRD